MIRQYPPPPATYCSERWNRNVAPIDRLSLAGEDFKSGRKWPTTTQGVQQVWDIVCHIDPME